MSKGRPIIPVEPGYCIVMRLCYFRVQVSLLSSELNDLGSDNRSFARLAPDQKSTTIELTIQTSNRVICDIRAFLEKIDKCAFWFSLLHDCFVQTAIEFQDREDLHACRGRKLHWHPHF
jgi:hypothetical protein